MVAYTDTIGFNKGSAASRAATNNRTYLQEVTLNFPEIIVDRAAASLTALAATDSLAVLHIPAKTLILAVGVDCTTVNTAASTIDIGYTGGDVDAWVDGFDTAAGGSAVGLGTNMTTAISTNYHNAADTLDVLFLTALQAQSIMRIWAVMVDCS